MAGMTDELKAIVVIVNGAAILDLNDPKRASAIDQLITKGVQFKVCNNSLIGQDVDPASLSAKLLIIPAAMPEIVRYQGAGYLYIKP